MQAITLANLPSKTAQEVFDYVAIHLLTQNKKAQHRNEYGVLYCRYQTPEGLRCAAGCLIAPEEYSDSFEGSSWYGLFGRGLVIRNHAELIGSLQQVHDSSAVGNWKNKLKEVAISNGLSTIVLE